jgi:hypothetical protein
MGTLELRFYRYKLNQVICPSCGLLKHFTAGVDARYYAEKHQKEHLHNNNPVELLVYDNDESVNQARTAKPGRAAGGVSLQNLY